MISKEVSYLKSPTFPINHVPTCVSTLIIFLMKNDRS